MRFRYTPVFYDKVFYTINSQIDSLRQIFRGDISENEIFEEVDEIGFSISLV